MKDITAKPTTLRSATAEARIALGSDGVALVVGREVDKGDVIEAARIAGLMAVKQTPFWLPHCHPIPILDTVIEIHPEPAALHIVATVRTIASTGVEMEALAAASATALCVYDMMKPHATEEMVVEGVRLVEKLGGKSHYRRAVTSGRAAVVVVSKLVATGAKDDTAGDAVDRGLRDAGFDVTTHTVLARADDELIAAVQAQVTDGVDVVVTVGGTGIGPDDRTVEVVGPLLTTDLPGLMEAARSYGQDRTPYALMSRGVAGLIDATVVATFPGSTRGAEETFAAVLPGIVHLVEALHRNRATDT